MDSWHLQLESAIKSKVEKKFIGRPKKEMQAVNLQKQ